MLSFVCTVKPVTSILCYSVTEIGNWTLPRPAALDDVGRRNFPWQVADTSGRQGAQLEHHRWGKDYSMSTTFLSFQLLCVTSYQFKRRSQVSEASLVLGCEKTSCPAELEVNPLKARPTSQVQYQRQRPQAGSMSVPGQLQAGTPSWALLTEQSFSMPDGVQVSWL